MNYQGLMYKRFIAALLSIAMIIMASPMAAYAEYTEVLKALGAYGNSSFEEAFTPEYFPNGGGYWDTQQIGLRFSLVDKEGDVKKTVDIFDFECQVGINQPILNGDRSYADTGVKGTIYDILTNNIKTHFGSFLYDAEYRVFNKCKIDVVKQSVEELKADCSTDSPLVIRADEYFKYEEKRTDPNCKWYCADIETVFRNAEIKLTRIVTQAYGVRDYLIKLSENLGDGSIEVAIPDAIDKFICNNITGRPRETLTQDTFDPGENTWLGMCDLLHAFGLNVYEGLSSIDLNDRQTLARLYNNLIREFVVPEYCIVVEPILFFGVALFEKIVETTGGTTVTFFERVKTAVYYGSVTELGILEKDMWVYDEDRGLYSKNYDYTFEILHEAVFTTCLGQQSAYVTEEYAYELEKCSMQDKLRTVSLADFVNWRSSNQINYEDLGYDDSDIYFTSYDVNIMKEYALGMALIVSTDFIKPQVETYDSQYRAETDVVTSLKVSNRSSTAYTTALDSTSITPSTVLNANGVPKAMVCKFTVSKISDASGDFGRWTADRTAVTTVYQQKLEELGFAKDSDGNYITEFYGSLDGIMPREYSDGQPTCYVSFNWKTPGKPCKVTFEVEFLNANGAPEAVLGTAEHDGLRATEITNTNGTYTTEFVCDITDGVKTTLFTEETVPPDSVAIISVASNSTSDPDEQALYDLNKDIYDAYKEVHNTNAAVYTGEDFAGKTIAENRSWSEYVALYDASGAIMLTHKSHTVSIELSKTTDTSFTDDTSAIIRTDQSGLYSDYAASIGSGYGIGIDFISSFNNDGAGDNYNRDIIVNGIVYENSLVTNYSHGVVMFPEYNYQTYYGELLKFDTDVDFAGRSSESRYMLVANVESKFYNSSIERPLGMTDEEYAIYSEANQDEKSRVHFTPVWYPDGTYQIVLCMFDAWTPAGELWFYKTYDIEIKGSIYDTWYVTRTYKNQLTS